MRPDNTADTIRPKDWWILGLAADPTPGDGGGVRVLAGNFHEFGDAAALSRASVQKLLSDPAVVSWVGDSAVAFEKACEPFPRHLALADQSYHEAGDALEAYAPLLETAQASADVALAYARAAIATVGLTGDALQGLGSADGDSDFRNRFGKLLIAHQPAPPPSPDAGKVPTDLPGPDPNYVIPGAAGLLSSASLDVLNEVVGYRRTAEQAGSDARSAAHKAAVAVGTAAAKAARVQDWTHDAAGHVVVGSKDGGSFDDRFSQFGGNLAALGALATAPHDDQALASRELAELNAALADPTAPWALALMGAVSSDLAENADPSRLQAFFAGGGAGTLAKISLALAPPDDREPYGTGPTPSAPAQAILASLGSVAASGSMFSQNGIIKLGPNAFDALTNAPVGQVYPGTALLKYGPDGSMWGNAVLGAIGLKMLATNYGSPEENSDKDALLTVMQRMSQNPDLCRLMVGSDGVGENNANYLLHSWYGTSDNPISQAAGQILTNATNDLSGNPDLSTKAAANLFHALDGSSLPSPLAQAVANTGAVQLESLMQDSTGHMADGPTLASGKIPLSAEQIDAVLKSFAGDQTSVQTIDTAIGLKVMHISQTGTLTSATDVPPDVSHLQQLGSLQGLVDTYQLQHGIDQAHDKDHVNVVKQAWLAAAFGGISAAPTPGGFGEVPFQMITGASGSAAPVFEHIWPTDGADDQIQQGGFTLSTKSGALSVPIVQGLINAHKISPPPGAPWFDPATGLVDVTGSLQAQNEFNDWLDNNGAAGLARVANKDVNTGYEQTAKSWNLK